MIDVRVMCWEGEDQIWSGPIRNRAALDAMLREHGERNISTWIFDDPHSLDCADMVLRLTDDRVERTYGDGRYCVSFGRLRKPAAKVTAPAATMAPVYGGFPLLDDQWPAADPEVRAPQTIAGGTRSEVPREISLLRLARAAWASFGAWLRGRPRLRVVSPEAAAARRGQ